MTYAGWNRARRAGVEEALSTYWADLATLASTLAPDGLRAAAELLLDTQNRDQVIYVIGNGGSAATASHFACDLAKGTRHRNAPTFRVIPLTDNVPLLTAWGNDASYDRIFAEQLASLARPGDLLVAISASGTSPNIVAAMDTARELDLNTVALTGRDGGIIAPIADVAIRVPSQRIEIVEDAHLAITHSLCVAVRSWLATGQSEVVRAVPLRSEPIDLTA